MSGLTPSQIIKPQVLNNFHAGDGQCLSPKLEARSVSAFYRGCCKIAPRLFISREDHEALQSLKQTLCQKSSEHDPDWAALVLLKAGVGKITTKDGEIVITARGLVGRRTLDRVSQATELSKEELIKDQKKKLSKQARSILGKRKRTESLDRSDSLDSLRPSSKRQLLMKKKQQDLEKFKIKPVSTKPTRGLKKEKEESAPLMDHEPFQPKSRKRTIVPPPSTESKPEEIQQRIITKPTSRRKIRAQKPESTPSQPSGSARPLIQFNEPVIQPKPVDDSATRQRTFRQQLFTGLQKQEPVLTADDLQNLTDMGFFEHLTSAVISSWSPEQHRELASLCTSAVGKSSQAAPSTSTTNHPTGMQQQLSPVTDQSRARETALFDKIKGRSCPDKEAFAIQYNLFQLLQEFEPALNDNDFVRQAKTGILQTIDADLTQSWEISDYQNLAAEVVKNVGKRPARKSFAQPAPISSGSTSSSSSKPSSESDKQVITYDQWAATTKSHHPIAYVVRCTGEGKCIEPGYIKHHLMPFVEEKLQTDFGMPLAASKREAENIFQELDLKPGDEKQAGWGQVASISRMLKSSGATYRQNHTPVALPQPEIPAIGRTLPASLQNRNHMLAFAELHSAGLVTRDEFVELYNRLPGQTLLRREFKEQLRAYQWLKQSGSFSLAQFTQAIHSGLLTPNIVTQIMEQKKRGAKPEAISSKLKAEPLPVAVFQPTVQKQTQVARAIPISQQRADEPRVSEPKVKAARISAHKLPDLSTLSQRPGMENFSNTCYFNSACRHLSAAIPRSTLEDIRSKPFKITVGTDQRGNPIKEDDRDALAVRDAFVQVMDKISNGNSRREQCSAAQHYLLNTCYDYGRKHPTSLIGELVRTQEHSRLSQEDASEFIAFISDILRLEEHDECTLRTAELFTLTVGGKQYSYQRPPNAPGLTHNVQLPPEMDDQSMTMQHCMDKMGEPQEPETFTWDQENLALAGYPGTYLPNGQKAVTKKSFVYATNDISKLETHTVSLGLFAFEWDSSVKAVTAMKQGSRARQAVGAAPEQITRQVFDIKTNTLHKVPMRLQSVVVHIGNSPRGGHYTSLLRGDDGKWVLFNDERVKVYPTLNDYLNEDKNRTPYQVSYAVAGKA